MTRFRPVLATIVALLFATLAPGLTTGAHAVPGGAVGTVYDAFTEDPVELATVRIWPSASYPSGAPVFTGTTDSDGDWESSALALGNYTLAISKAGYTQQLESFDITDAGATAAVFADLRPASWGTLTGTVKVGAATAPTGCATVRIYGATSGDEVYSTVVAGRGAWTAPLPVGSYQVRVEPDDCAGSETGRWAPDAADEAGAHTYTVAKNTSSTVPTVVLPANPVIAGVVTSASGKPLAGVAVRFERIGGGSDDSVATDEKGRYRSRELTGGAYRVFLEDTANEYLEQFHDGTTDPDSTNPVSVAVGETRTVNVALTRNAAPLPPAALTGTVTDTAGKPLRGIPVFLMREDGEGSAQGATRDDGSYRIDRAAVTRGTYLLGAGSPSGSGGLGEIEHMPFDAQFYGGSLNVAKATRIPVPATGSITLNPIRLNRLGQISGTAAVPTPTTASPVPSGLGAGLLTLRNQDGTLVGIQPAVGEFTFPSLRPGRYYVELSDLGPLAGPLAGMLPRFIPSWWKNGYSLATATPIVIGQGTKVTGITITPSTTLRAVAKPRIIGKAKGKKVLRATTGTWNLTADVAFSYVWKRGSKVVGRAATYKVTKADRGKKLTVTVTATDRRKDLRSGSSTSKPVKVAKR
ncbi:carboxypeptidase regulatory-like domain-containing protein [Nocardioides sp. Bht2]|uniref:carboxypeptidase regulatory-like domain-containing protein n=1 Tax=Nocardioides sp. Bht2 TaxID=3392297 RepID=UPI0039B5DC6A